MIMRHALVAAFAASVVCALSMPAAVAGDFGRDDHDDNRGRNDQSIQLGPRPFYLVDGMDPGPLKSKLMKCMEGPFHRTNFSISHRGAPLQFPEHTREGYEAAARM